MTGIVFFTRFPEGHTLRVLYGDDVLLSLQRRARPIKCTVWRLTRVTVDALLGLCSAIIPRVVTGRAVPTGWSVTAVVTGMTEPQAPEAPHGVRDVGSNSDSDVAYTYFTWQVNLVKGQYDVVGRDRHASFPGSDPARRHHSKVREAIRYFVVADVLQVHAKDYASAEVFGPVDRDSDG